MPKRTEPRNKRDISKKRYTILKAATQVFALEGYDAASMDRIAEVSGASKRTVYNHYSSKDLLLREVIDQFMSESHKLKEIPYDRSKTLASQLKRFADAILSLTTHEHWLGLTRVMTGITIKQAGFVAEVMTRHAPLRDPLEDWLRAAVEDGRMQIDDPALTAQAFWAALTGAFLMPAIYMGPLPASVAEKMKTELVGWLLAKYAGPPHI